MAPILTDMLSNLYAVALVAFGIGFVIFIHELGHFLAAKWAGVKVEKFALGFGPVLVSFRKGLGYRLGSTMKEYEAALKDGTAEEKAISETEYSIRALPLGGFVGMLGEGTGEEATKSTDPRAFPNKPVGKRMVIICAGVVMNMILGLICHTWVFYNGILVPSAKIGAVVAGQPAYEAGLRPGDEIVAIDGRREVTYEDLLHAVVLSGTGQKVRLEVKRPGAKDEIPLEIEPKRSERGMAPQIGVLPSSSTKLFPRGPKNIGGEPRSNATIVAATPEGEGRREITAIDDLFELLAKHRDRPITFSVKSKAGDKEVTQDVTLPGARFVDLGLRLKAGPVMAVRPGSPADKAKFRAKDRIVSVDGDPAFDPMRLPDLAYAHAGQAMSVEVAREVDGKPTSVTLQVTPDSTPPWIETQLPSEPLDVAGLGMAIAIEPTVAAVAPGSPADKAGIKPGEAITSATFPMPTPEEDGSKTPQKPGPKVAWDTKHSASLTDGSAAWTDVFDALQREKTPMVRLAVGSPARPVDLTAEPVEGWYAPSRGLDFLPLLVPLPPQSIAQAFQRGMRKTSEDALSFYVIIRSLFQRRVSPSTIVGPLPLATMAFNRAKYSNITEFIEFIAMISINLAVVNFLPIPPLDGGQMTFLVAEKIRGRPLPDDAVLWPTLVGFGLVLILFVVVMVKDVLSYF